jgi:hypothetical protein
MHPSRFDAISQVFSVTRRRTLGGLFAGALALFSGVRPVDGAASSHCQPPCGVCYRCQKRHCRRTKRGRRCRPGRCRPLPTGTPCGEDRICQRGACLPRCGEGGPCHVFITSSTHDTGDLGGLAGADAICQNLAEAAGLPGIYRAWLSDDTAWPANRFSNTKSTGPYVLVNGTLIATDWADLTDGTIAAPIDVTERRTRLGTRVPRSSVWTNTSRDGTVGGFFDIAHCLRWTHDTAEDFGNTGRNDRTDAGWTAFSFSACDGAPTDLPHRLYCFEQG